MWFDEGMQKAFGRIYDPKSMTYSFADGNCTLTAEKVEEMKAIIELRPTIGGMLIATAVKDDYLKKMRGSTLIDPN